MKLRTRWKNNKNISTIGQRLLHESFGFFTITKIQSCKEYCGCAETPEGSHWFDKKRAFIKTETGLKYVVPYLWLYLTSVDENGNYLKR